MKIGYEDWNPTGDSLALVDTAEQICEEYAAKGYDLTLRQLYYQFVARGFIPNHQRSYKRLGSVIDRARKAGLLDWDYIVDRTRNLRGYTTYTSPADLVREMEGQFHVDLWEDQDYMVEVWVEKEALAGVIARASLAYGVDYFSCRGYVSQSELHAAALRHRAYEDAGKRVVVVHLGDHDPSGIDMTRDIQDRLRLFGAHTVVNRIALNLNQVEEFNPPPNPAKLTDSRVGGYIERFGSKSWELDALDPETLAGLIKKEITDFVDPDAFNIRVDIQKEGRAQLRKVARHWSAVSRQMREIQE
jgi:hypothetical protein